MEDNKLCLEKQPLNQEMLDKIDAYWRAANYLAAAQLYLLDNPLLREPLKPEHIKKKIVGHWGTVPGQNFVYCHMNRAIKKYDLDMVLISGPGHGGNFFVANSYLEGTYSEVYPNVSQDMTGLKKLCKQFSLSSDRYIFGFKIMLNINSELTLREITDMSVRSFHIVIRTEKFLYCFHFCR